MEREWPVIIAMQGDPYTGKTCLANALAKLLQIPTVRLDDILDVISPVDNNESDRDKLISHAFDLVAQFVKTHISLGHSIIVDAPLCRRSHLQKLVRLLDANDDVVGSNEAKLSLVIVECKPGIEYAWQMRFEERDSKYDEKWYKPHAWPMDPEFARDYTDDDGVHPSVSKVIVDTTDQFPLDHVVLAVNDLTACSKGHKVELNKWRPIHCNNPHKYGRHECCHFGSNHTKEKEAESSSSSRRRLIHQVHEYNKLGETNAVSVDVACWACLNKESNYYTCSHCSLALHKSCAELEPAFFTPENFPKFLNTTEPKASYCYPEEILCSQCREEGKEFSYECESCIFQTHLKCRLIPTIIHHKGHPHLLQFVALSVLVHKPLYLCTACKRRGSYAFYVCGDECKGCYHPECVLLPPVVRGHSHGGYTHDLQMVCEREEEMEDYLCDLCFDLMNPQAWYYSCKECRLSFHLECAFKDFS